MRELTRVSPHVLLPDGHALTSKATLAAPDLAGHPMVLLDAPPSRDYFLSILSHAGVEANVAYRSTSFEMLSGLVGNGLGFALLATKPASAMTYDGKALVMRPLKTDIEPSSVVLASRTGVELSPPAERFAVLCCQFFDLDP